MSLCLCDCAHVSVCSCVSMYKNVCTCLPVIFVHERGRKSLEGEGEIEEEKGQEGSDKGELE